MLFLLPYTVGQLFAAPLPSATADEASAKDGRQHFRFYGFVRNYFAWDSRESVAGIGDLFYFLPYDREMNEDGTQDLNAQSSFRFFAITSRIGLDVSGYRIGRTEFGGKVETDFYNLTNGTDGTARLRLRQAYMTITWNGLDMGRETAYVTLKIGQGWHPLSIDQPPVTGLDAGTPFNPFGRTPLILMDASLGKHFILSAGAMWQMQMRSMGPNGSSAEYIKYSGIPECYLGLTFRTEGGFIAKAGTSVLSIKPRRTGTLIYAGQDGTPLLKEVKVSDRLTTFIPYICLRYAKDNFDFRTKFTYSYAGEHLNMLSGYGISSTDFDDGHYEYTPLQTASSWFSISYGRKWQVILMSGYTKNLGSLKPLVSDRIENGISYINASSHIYFNRIGFPNINSMWRVMPTLQRNIGKFSIAFEYNLTGVQYGDYKVFDDEPDVNYLYSATGLATDNLHWVINHRLQMMVKFSF